jgi:predicted phage terminase large subunit-like protein
MGHAAARPQAGRRPLGGGDDDTQASPADSRSRRHAHHRGDAGLDLRQSRQSGAGLPLGRYEGTNLGRQEIYAELIEEAEGALWTRAMVEAARAPAGQAPPLSRVIVAIDPAVTHGEKSDETGIVVAGLGEDATVYVLADGSGKLAPDAWARRAVSLYELHRADRVIGETNNGGELVELTVRAVAPRIPYRGVTASRGKRARAEPISALYAQGKVRHVGAFPALEDQMCNWVPGAEDFSPDRLDALVWAISELVYGGGDTGMLDFYRAQAGKR